MSEQTFFVPGPLPGMNEIVAAAKVRHGKFSAYSQMKSQWTNTVASLAKIQNLRPVRRARLSFLWVEPTKRRDPDNVGAAKKFILDGLVEACVLPCDGWKCIEGFIENWIIDQRAPGVWVTLTCEDDENPETH